MAETGQKASPKISIIVPVYNTARYLARCLDSIAAQTFADWECICVDDGSPDASGAILDEYAAKDSRFVVLHQENGGVSRARNAGLDAARGEWVSFVDSDDWIEPETFALAHEAAAAHNADLVQWDYVFEDNGKRIVGLSLAEGPFSVSKNATYFCPSMCHKLVLRKLIYDNHLLFPENIRLSEDRLFSFQCSLLARRAFHLNRALYHYTANASSASHNMTREMILEEVEVVKEMEKFSLDFERNAVLTGEGGGMTAPRSFSRRSWSRSCTRCSVCLNRTRSFAARFSRKQTASSSAISCARRRGRLSFCFLYTGIWISPPAPAFAYGGFLRNGKRRKPQLCTGRAA